MGVLKHIWGVVLKLNKKKRQTKMASSSGDDVLSMDHFNEVNQTCEQFSAKWEKIGGRLDIRKNTIDIIARNNNKDALKCMSELIATWLKRETLEQPLPTWKMLCTALATVDRTAAEKIAIDKGCQLIITHTDQSYIGQICYEKIGHNKWQMKLIVFSDIDAFIKYASRITTKDQAFRFTFLDPVDGYIELVLEDIDQVTSQGWNIEPHKDPLRILKKDVDLLGSHDLASCILTVWTESSKTHLSHPVTLSGIDSDTTRIYVRRFLETAEKITSHQQQDKDTTHHIDDAIPNEVSLENLTANSAMRLMKDCGIRLSKWSDIGGEFGVPVDKREEIRLQRLSSQESLEECLEYWMRNISGDKSWKSLIDIVEKQEKVTAKKMRSRLGIKHLSSQTVRGRGRNKKPLARSSTHKGRRHEIHNSTQRNPFFSAHKMASEGGNVLCSCGENAVLLTVKKENKNKGRQFYKCPKDDGDAGKCRFFLWALDGFNRHKSGSSSSCGSQVSSQTGNSFSRGKGKGRARTSSVPPAKKRAPSTCSICNMPGHTKRTCPRAYK